jgi:poly-gamma-glutamate capsule biosynthesis protein CapA/YwtB (metallophosphatase superfamily)
MKRVRALAMLAAVTSICASPPSALAQHKLRSVTLEWVGDIALSGQLGLPPGGVGQALRPVRPLLGHADLTLGNLEGTLSVGGVSKCARLGGGQCFAFQAPPSEALGLRSLGFDLVNQANNHSMDYGPSGRAQTVSALDGAGIAHTGFPNEITYLSANHIRIAFLGFAPYPYDGNLLDIPGAQSLVREAKRHAGLVVVIIHAGAEGAGALHTPYGTEYYLGENRGDARAFAHAVIDAGATVVLGSGPHVIRGVEHYHQHLIAYSLGNFVGYHTLGGGGVLDDSAIMRVTIGAHGHLLAARWLPITLVDGLPRPDPTHASVALMKQLSREDFPGDHFDVEGDGVFRIAVGN